MHKHLTGTSNPSAHVPAVSAICVWRLEASSLERFLSTGAGDEMTPTRRNGLLKTRSRGYFSVGKRERVNKEVITVAVREMRLLISLEAYK